MYLKLIILTVLFFSGCVVNKDNLVIVKDNSSVKKKKKSCDKYIKIMNYASLYIENEFETGYFQQNNILGVKAQLFLIQNQSKSIFAQNINNAEKSFKIQYKQAKNERCNLEEYKLSPLEKIKNRIKKIDDNNKNRRNK